MLECTGLNRQSMLLRGLLSWRRAKRRECRSGCRTCAAAVGCGERVEDLPQDSMAEMDGGDEDQWKSVEV